MANVQQCTQTVSTVGTPQVGARVRARSAERSVIGLRTQWVAPEVFREQAYTKASDVYSYGVVLWELVMQAIPYEVWDSCHS